MSTQRRRLLEDDGGITAITDDGVYIEGLNGKFYTVDNWQGGNNANSIVVTIGDVKFRIALTESSSYMPISTRDTTPIDYAMTAISAETAAKADYNGATNTANIIKFESSTSCAAGYCNAYIFPDGKTKGILPSLGQLWLAYQNKADVDSALSKCGGIVTSKYYWSSTFWGVYNGYRECWNLNWLSDTVTANPIDYKNRARPFADLT